MDIELKQLVTATEAATLKGISLNRFKYHIAKPGAPEPVVIGNGHVFYDKRKIRAWKPIKVTQQQGG